MQRMMTREERAARDADFANRLKPRTLWPSTQEGTASRVVLADGTVAYDHHERPEKRKAKLTEAQDNAIGRAIRRREHRQQRGWLPHCKR